MGTVVSEGSVEVETTGKVEVPVEVETSLEVVVPRAGMVDIVGTEPVQMHESSAAMLRFSNSKP